MVSTEVQRTLVKSPPELWAELSDAEALSRHLGQLGEIRITRLEPESEVAWEAARASGSVQIKPSAWGTRVKLSVTHEPAPARVPPEGADGAPSPGWPQTAAAQAAARAHVQSLTPQAASPTDHRASAAARALEESAGAQPPLALDSAPAAAQAPVPEPIEDVVTSTPASEDAEVLVQASPLPTRRGLLTRLLAGFRRQRGSEPALALVGERPGESHEQAEAPAPAGVDEQELPPLLQAERIVPLPAPLQPSAIEALQARFEVAHEEPPAPAELAEQAPPGAGDAPDGAEAAGCHAPAPPPEAAADPCADELETMLGAMLDSLGAAHHRPFSRA